MQSGNLTEDRMERNSLLESEMEDYWLVEEDLDG
jgi:hypothetical protein